MFQCRRPFGSGVTGLQAGIATIQRGGQIASVPLYQSRPDHNVGAAPNRHSAVVERRPGAPRNWGEGSAHPTVWPTKKDSVHD